MNDESGAKVCKECGTSLAAVRDYRAEFCGTPCRKNWNNRRMTRGAELYDVFMTCRYARGFAKLKGLWTIMCRMGSIWRGEDHDSRAGRASWGAPEIIVQKTVRYHRSR
jgi:hypothetical protein